MTREILVEVERSPTTAPVDGVLDAFEEEIGRITGMPTRVARVTSSASGRRPKPGRSPRSPRSTVRRRTSPSRPARATCTFSSSRARRARGRPTPRRARDRAGRLGVPRNTLPPPYPASDAAPLAPPRHLRLPGVERAIAIHEAGHGLGLVHHGLRMVTPRLWAPGDPHSCNPASLMRSSVDTTFDYLVPGQERPIPYRLDADDVADVRAYQESRRSV